METNGKGIEFRKIKDSNGSVLTGATVSISEGVKLSGWLVTEKEKKISVIPPSVPYTTKDGEKKYKDLITFADDKVKWAWVNRIRKHYQEWKELEGRLDLLQGRLELYNGLFRGRTDVFAKRWESKDGRSGYQPACANEWKRGVCSKPCSACQHREYLPLTEQVYLSHLYGTDSRGKPFIVGVYPLIEDNTSYFIAADFDGEKALEETQRFDEVLALHGTQSYVERSRSGKGYHVWIFFKDKIPAWKSRGVLLRILENTNISNRAKEGFDRLFPNQDEPSGKGLGNLIALPLQGESVRKGNSVFLNPANRYEPYEDQWEFLKSVRKVSEKEFDDLANGWKLEPKKSTVVTPKIMGSRQDLDRVIENCDFIKHTIEHADSLKEPLWYCMVSNLAVFEGGGERIHGLSKPYPQYSWAETDAKIRHALKDTSPHTCEHIRKEGFNCSKDCGVKSPAGLPYRNNNVSEGGQPWTSAEESSSSLS